LIRDLYIDLSESQRQRYDEAEREGTCKLDTMGDEITIEHVFELIRWLKMICNFDPNTGESAKADHVLASLEEIAQSGKKAILFSQYVTTLETLRERLSEFSPLVYHGKIPQKQREAILAEFKQDDSKPLLMLSYATGAVGLNLQFTNYVFLYDRWWNPAIEDQAINRAHRIGQKEPVFVFRYISPNTIEERIAHVLDQKRDLFSDLIDGLDPAESGLTREDVFGLFNLQIRPRNAA
jgi:SNF2 family DNA or RNA helicase